MHVVAAVMIDAAGRVLLAQRPPGKHLAGLWEFPGGKLEPGESPAQAMARELHEELGIELDPAVPSPLIRVPWRYGERDLLLDAWSVRQWRGEPASLEGQALRWLAPADIDPQGLTPADRPILQALRLPACYAITPDAAAAEIDAWTVRLEALIERRAGEPDGPRLCQLRFPAWPVETVRRLAARLLPLARQRQVQLVLNADIDGARELGLGVQLKAAQLAQLDARPLPLSQLVGASCHDERELRLAERLGADFATLSPVLPTASHPGASPLGWAHFQALAEAAALPVYALGGLSPMLEAAARAASGQGVAGIRGFWDSEPAA